MAITINWNPSALLVGNAANQAGLGQYAQRQQQFAEQQYQFDARQGLAEQEMATRAASVQAEQQAREQELAQRAALAQQQLGLQYYQTDSQLWDRDQSRQAQLYSQQVGGQYDLLREGMQQGGINNRFGAQLDAQRESQLQDHISKQMQAQWAEVQKAMPRLNPEERQELYDNFVDAYGYTGLPMPIQTQQQELPDWMDPEKQLAQAHELAPGLPWGIDPETGTLSLPRGFSPQMSPEYREWEAGKMREQQQWQYDKAIDVQRMKTDLEMQKAQTKSREAARTNQQKQALAQLESELDQEWDQHKDLKPNPIDYKIDKPFTDPKTGKVTYRKEQDSVSYRNDVEAWKEAGIELKNQRTQRYSEFNAQQQNYSVTSGPVNGSQLPPPQQPQAGSTKESAIPVADIAEAATYPKGTWVRTPDGRVGQVK